MKPILFVDDERDNRLSFRALFRRKYPVLLAGSAQRARNIIRSQAVQMVLSDQRMPGQTGLELFEWLRIFRPEIVRILVTGSISNEQKEQALAGGVIDLLIQKPWDIQDLETIISENLEES